MSVKILITILELLKKDEILFIPSSKVNKEISEKIKNCKQCKLHKTRTNIVIGEGDLNAALMFVGEAPGQNEDLQGKPFVGEAGKLLTKIINAMNLKREDVYIANIIKCRPPNNRDPEPDEISSCLPYLLEQIKIIQPKIICTLGRISTKVLLKTNKKITELRGKFYDFNGIKVMPTFHPAHLLHHPENKRLVWNDMQLIMKELNLTQNSDKF